MSKQQVVHIHGGTCFNNYEDYLTTLKSWDIRIGEEKKRWSKNYYEFLDRDEYEVIRPDMPSKHNAKYGEWVIWFEKLLPYLKDNVILVGHSLGGLFLTRYLSENILSVSIKQLHLVAAPYDDNGNGLETLGDFRIQQFPKEFFDNTIKDIFLYYSSDDDIVDIKELEKYAKVLPEAKVHSFDDRWHFLGETFPELFENIKNK